MYHKNDKPNLMEVSNVITILGSFEVKRVLNCVYFSLLEQSRMAVKHKRFLTISPVTVSHTESRRYFQFGANLRSNVNI